MKSPRFWGNTGVVGFLAVSLCGLWMTGCWSSKPAPPVTKAPPPPKAVAEGWPVPALALVLSGEQHGYLEPCGCSATQSGGMARRADLLKQLGEKGWPVISLDLGATLKRRREQDRIKFETVLAGLKKMDYSALALGLEELQLSPEFLLSQHLPEELPFLAANVVFFDSPDLGTPVPFRIIEAGGVKVGVTAIFGQSYQQELGPVGTADAITITEPAEVLPGVLEKMQAEKPDLFVLLSHAKVKETLYLGKEFPQFDLILTAGGPEEPTDKPLATRPLVLTVGGKGKHVGLVGFYPSDKKAPLKYELVDLDQGRFKNAPEMRELMQIYQDRLKDSRIAEELKPLDHPSGATYVGAQKCGECHTKAYDKWKNSKHAHAYESLIKGRKGQEKEWISRIHDPECLACHVTGWNPQDVYPYTGGFVSAEKSPLLMGQQCENCHGPGSQHTEAEEQWKISKGPPSPEVRQWRSSMHLDTKVAKDRVCFQCHDFDNSPNFEFEKYWKDIVHPWRD